MKHCILLYLLVCFAVVGLQAQIFVGSSGIHIEDSTVIGVGQDLYLQADVSGKGELVMLSSQPQIIDGQGNAISRLKLRNTSRISLQSDLTIQDSLSLLKGSLDLQNFVLYLSEDAWLSEAPTTRVNAADGYFETYRDLGSPNLENIAGLGITISSSKSLGYSAVRRGHQIQYWHSGASTERYYELISSDNDSLSSLDLAFRQEESGNQALQNWQLLRSANSGNDWEILVQQPNFSAETLQLNQAEAGYRWTLFPPNVLFPVEWLKVDARWENGRSHVSWTTREENVDFYEIQRSLDGRLFGELGQTEALKNGKAQNNYLYIDSLAKQLGLNQLFYRIKQVDLDGQYDFSKILVVNIPRPSPRLFLIVTPNPVREVLHYQYAGGVEVPLHLQITTTLGQMVYDTKVNATQGEQIKAQLNVSHLAAGYYFLSLTDGQQKTTFKFIRE